MSSTKTPLISANFTAGIDHFRPLEKPIIFFRRNPSKVSTLMWKNFAKQTFSKSLLNSQSSSSRGFSCFLGKSQESNFSDKFKFFWPVELIPSSSYVPGGMGFGRNGKILMKEDCLRRFSFDYLRNPIGFNGFGLKGYASVAEAVSSTDIDDDFSVDEEFHELLQEMNKEEKRQVGHRRRRRRRIVTGMAIGRYEALKKRQVKIETEAWAQAAKEYRELLMDMCKQNLAPNLPYMKSLFLGWFEPLSNAIETEQEAFRQGKNRTMYAPYFTQLPAEMMAVITMHKLMGLLMTGSENGIARVVQAACVIGDAIEQEV